MALIFSVLFGSGIILGLLTLIIRRISKGIVLPILLIHQVGFLWIAAQGLFYSTEWLPLHIKWSPLAALFQFSFYLDALSLVFLFLIALIGIGVTLFSAGYFKNQTDLYRCLGLLYLFMIGMIGVVSADNLLFLFVCWEITTLTSYMLIGFKGEYFEARQSALNALIITGMGGLCFLTALILLAPLSGTLNLSELLSSQFSLSDKNFQGTLVLLLILTAAFTKSAQFPFHFWLPGAMTAPTPVSAYLHSATMVKAGVFLVARMFPLFSGMPLWHGLLIGVGSFTALWSIVAAFKFNDLKQILAYSTVSALGLLMFFLGLGTKAALTAAILFLVVHAFYKAGLFMVAGAIDVLTGTRDHSVLGKLFSQLPKISAILTLLCFSMMGLPPLIGFLAKEYFYEALLGLSPANGTLLTVTIFINAFTFALAYKVLSLVWKKSKFKTNDFNKIKSEPWLLWISAAGLGFLGIFLGLFPELLAKGIVAPGVSALMQDPVNIYLKLWHGLNAALILSALTFLLGILIYFFQDKIFYFLIKLKIPSAEKVYLRVVEKNLQFFKFCTQLLFPYGYQGSLMIFMTGIAGFLLLALINLWPRLNLQLTAYGNALDLIIILCVLASALGCIVFKNALSLFLSAGVAGFGVSFYFALYSAPDLALTQFLVETFVLVLFVFVSQKLLAVEKNLQWIGKIYSMFLALALASLLTLMTFVMVEFPLGQRISQFFANASYLQAHGKNVVNVILVDFRAFDTLGEITVLAIAIIGVYRFIHLKNKKERS